MSEVQINLVSVINGIKIGFPISFLSDHRPMSNVNLIFCCWWIYQLVFLLIIISLVEHFPLLFDWDELLHFPSGHVWSHFVSNARSCIIKKLLCLNCQIERFKVIFPFFAIYIRLRSNVLRLIVISWKKIWFNKLLLNHTSQ